jgi:DNA-binding sugar fermentation-stimulating protein
MLMKLESVVKGTVLKRPSAAIKSPYVADVLLDDGRTVLAHSAALGCCGLSDKGATIWLQAMPVKKTTDTTKCSHRVCLSTLYDTVREKSVTVGIFPKYAEELAEKALVGNHLRCLQGVRKYRRETVLKVDGLVDSRFDFSGIDGHSFKYFSESVSIREAKFPIPFARPEL